MTKLINIAKTGQEPIYLDPADVTLLRFESERGKEYLAIHTSKGQTLGVSLDEVDCEDIVQKLATQGRVLNHVSVPGRSEAYIAPDAITFAIASKLKDGSMGISFCVKGWGLMVSYKAKATEWEAMLQNLRSHKAIAEYGPLEVHCSGLFYESATLYVEPQSVTRILPQSPPNVEVNLGAFRITVVTGKTDWYVSQDDIHQMSETGMLEDFKQFSRDRKKEEKEAGQNFADKLAAAGGKLIGISSSYGTVYLSREDIASVSFYQSRFEDDRSPYGLQIKGYPILTGGLSPVQTLQFKTPEERQAAFATLQAALDDNSSKTPQKKPFGPKPGAYM